MSSRVRWFSALVLLLICLAVVSLTKVGPVIMTLSSTHGVHLCDLVVFPLAALALGLVLPMLHRRH